MKFGDTGLEKLTASIFQIIKDWKRLCQTKCRRKTQLWYADDLAQLHVGHIRKACLSVAWPYSWQNALWFLPEQGEIRVGSCKEVSHSYLVGDCHKAISHSSLSLVWRRATLSPFSTDCSARVQLLAFVAAYKTAWLWFRTGFSIAEGLILVVCHLPHVQCYPVGLGTWGADTTLTLLML